MSYVYAALFTGASGHRQIKTDVELAYMGLDWDIRVRTPAIIAVADPASAQILTGLGPITDVDKVVKVQSVLGGLVSKLRTASDAATAASGWSIKVSGASSIMTGLCMASWGACEGSLHGHAWRIANSILSKDIVTRIAASDVSVLGRYAARAVTWRAYGAKAVSNFASFEPEAVKPLFAEALARIRESRAAFIKMF
jgi:hypothetical protein